ncbi:unnamed protein product [Closterium sp. Yama58-4]|nr:unnamed protein product [Closterium sp. Yama58-4]
MAGNMCGACGLELDLDNLLRTHLYRNDTCRDTLLERLESRAVEALAEALAVVRNSPHHSDTESVLGSPHSADSLFRFLRESPAHADFVRGYVSSSDDGSVSTVGDLFNTLNELYLFFKDADLSDREINRGLHTFNHPGYDPAAVRRWQNVADVRRYGEEHTPDDMVPWLKAEIEVRGPGGRSQMLELLFKDTKLIAQRMVKTFVNVRGFVKRPRQDPEDTDDTRHFSGTAEGGFNGPGCHLVQQQHLRVEEWTPIGMANADGFGQCPGGVTMAEARARSGGCAPVSARVGIDDGEDSGVSGGLSHRDGGPLRYFDVSDGRGGVVKAYPCLYAFVGDYPEGCRATATMQQASHRPCSSCYIKRAHLHDLSHKFILRNVKRERHATAKILSATSVDDAAAVQASRKFGVKGDTRSALVRILGGSTFFRSGANYAAFEYRGMMQVFPIIISDLRVGCSAEERDQRDKEVRAFRYYAVFFKSLLAVTKHTRLTLAIARQHGISLVAALQGAFPKQKSKWNFVKLHEIVHLIDGISMRAYRWHESSTELWEHTHKGTVKGPVRGSNWKDIPRRIVEEETQREITREIAALSGGGRTYYTALREAVRNMKPALTRTSKAMCLMAADDPLRMLYREMVGSEFDNMATLMAAAGLQTARVLVRYRVVLLISPSPSLACTFPLMRALPFPRHYHSPSSLRSLPFPLSSVPGPSPPHTPSPSPSRALPFPVAISPFPPRQLILSPPPALPSLVAITPSPSLSLPFPFAISTFPPTSTPLNRRHPSPFPSLSSPYFITSNPLPPSPLAVTFPISRTPLHHH